MRDAQRERDAIRCDLSANLQPFGWWKFPEETSGRGTEGRRWERLGPKGEARRGGYPKVQGRQHLPSHAHAGRQPRRHACRRLHLPRAPHGIGLRPSARGRHAQRLPLRAVPRRRPFQRSCDSALAMPHDPPQRRLRRCRGASVCLLDQPPSTRGTAATHAPPHAPRVEGAPRPLRGACLPHAACLVTVWRHCAAWLVLSAARPGPRTFSPLRRDSVRDPSKKKPVGEVLPTGKRMGARMHTRMHACTHDAGARTRMHARR